MKSLLKGSVWLIVGVGLVVLAACGGTPESPAPPDSSIRIITATPRNTAIPTVTPTPQVAQLPQGTLDGLRVDFWYVWDPTRPDTLQALLSKFNRQNPDGIVVESKVFYHSTDFISAIQEAIANRTAPDIALAHPYEYLPWQAVGALVDLTPYLESPDYGLPPIETGQFYPALLKRDLYGSLRWGFPGLLSARVLLYNQSWAQDLGFETPPANAAAFTRQACAAHIANADRTGGWMIDTSPGSAAAWLLAFSGGLESGGRYDFGSDAVEAGFTFLSELQTSGCAWQPSLPYPDQAFIDRLGLFYPVSTREIGFVQQAFEQSASPDQWTAIGYPNDLGERRVSLYGTSYVILGSSPEQQIAAWLVIRSLTSPANQRFLAEQDLYLPLSREVSTELQADQGLPAAWLAALDLLEQAVSEPRFTSWRVVRGVVQDALSEVMDERFLAGTMSLFLKQLEELVADLHQSNR